MQSDAGSAAEIKPRVAMLSWGSGFRVPGSIRVRSYQIAKLPMRFKASLKFCSKNPYKSSRKGSDGIV